MISEYLSKYFGILLFISSEKTPIKTKQSNSKKDLVKQTII